MGPTFTPKSTSYSDDEYSYSDIASDIAAREEPTKAFPSQGFRKASDMLKEQPKHKQHSLPIRLKKGISDDDIFDALEKAEQVINFKFNLQEERKKHPREFTSARSLLANKKAKLN